MNITKQDVEKVAKLARLEVTDAEKEVFAKQLSQILSHVQTLNQYDTGNVEQTSSVPARVNVFREDEVRPSLSVEQALANAPRREANGFSVPKIIE
ncbi:Aspartyl/glutamyl-tRNA amidotransferase subunit C [Nitrospira sp. KM1]|uniref:Asp-tRNA(Asn)/Glu-tRNA(Gln) amidotransferase subunit GatC n=1 Tax=Nitrospira sp. KM1 TaxID=1936990 RepID=UPI0013A77834|nr:Asp-tRNA(Asn)/Glu-tRNA(Gln) amidotransferase subunit GatC [Nitrospira sp. KM1]BCA54164.1 Aspartyl/glutamyl-tRNA amidotransferase subunit C [Nitrospira sp. KM1]